eukprot:UN0376
MASDMEQMLTGGRVLEQKFEGLSEEDQAKVMALHDAHSGEGPATLLSAGGSGHKTVKGIFKTNCLGAGVDAEESLLCAEVSRFNHSCVQNVAHAWAPPHERVYAVRDIKKGEELCTCYFGQHASYAERQARLKMVYGFDCSCAKCSTDPAERARSDKRRSQYAQLDERIPQVGAYDQKQALALILDAIELTKQEEPLNQPCVIKRHAYDAYQMSCAMKNLMQAKKWIQVAYDNELIENGEDHHGAQVFARLVKNPKAHPLWR